MSNIIKIPAEERMLSGSKFLSRISPVAKNNSIMEARRVGRRKPVKIAYIKTKISAINKAEFLFSCKALSKRKMTAKTIPVWSPLTASK